MCNDVFFFILSSILWRCCSTVRALINYFLLHIFAPELDGAAHHCVVYMFFPMYMYTNVFICPIPIVPMGPNCVIVQLTFTSN